MGAEKMTDKDFKKLGRRDLLDIIYKLQLSEAQLRDENARLRKELEDKSKLSEPGSIADATVGITELFKVAQETADTYIAEVKKSSTETELRSRSIIEAAEREAEQINIRAKLKAETMVFEAQEEVDAKWKQLEENAARLLEAHEQLSTLFGELTAGSNYVEAKS